MRVKNFLLLREIIVSNGDELINLFEIAKIKGLKGEKLHAVIAVDEVVMFLEEQNCGIEKIVEKHNELACGVLHFTANQVEKIVERYNISDTDFEKIFRINILNIREVIKFSRKSYWEKRGKNEN